MGVTTFTQEYSSSVAPSRMFKALIIDSKNLLPRLLPHFVKDVNVIQGDGEAGSIEQVNFNEASPFKYLKHRIDVLDKDNLFCKYTMIEGDPLGDKLESIAYEVKFEASNDRGCLCKMKSNYNTIGEFEVKEEEVKEGRESTIAIYKVVESYLRENPQWLIHQMQTPRVTQIQVRVDCNGCVQKIKKALNDIHGIHDLRVDFSRQKLTILGWADPEKVVKAIKKTKKNATICSNIELRSPTEEESIRKGNAPAQDATQPPSTQAPPSQASLRSEPPPEKPPTLATSHTHTQHVATRQRHNNPGTKHVHMTHQHQPNYANRFNAGHSFAEQCDRYHNNPVSLQEPSHSMHVTHSYNTYMPSHYVTEYEHIRSPSRHAQYNSFEHYSGDCQNDCVNFSSMFSDDNPNACTIV
ncbi:hypothetical protein RJT34_32283 [Clitoria ternatea]|uniref:HMA domain-containing protein n=1 Tax=Clitoria ternatea TaxID=43366 RepID=A0AAN9EXF1_CLITE